MCVNASSPSDRTEIELAQMRRRRARQLVLQQSDVGGRLSLRLLGTRARRRGAALGGGGGGARLVVARRRQLLVGAMRRRRALKDLGVENALSHRHRHKRRNCAGVQLPTQRVDVLLGGGGRLTRREQLLVRVQRLEAQRANDLAQLSLLVARFDARRHRLRRRQPPLLGELRAVERRNACRLVAMRRDQRRRVGAQSFVVRLSRPSRHIDVNTRSTRAP